MCTVKFRRSNQARIPSSQEGTRSSRLRRCGRNSAPLRPGPRHGPQRAWLGRDESPAVHPLQHTYPKHAGGRSSGPRPAGRDAGSGLVTVEMFRVVLFCSESLEPDLRVGRGVNSMHRACAKKAPFGPWPCALAAQPARSSYARGVNPADLATPSRTGSSGGPDSHGTLGVP